MKLKEAKGQRQGRLICETGAMEGYLKDISQRVGEGEGEWMGARQRKKIWACANQVRRLLWVFNHISNRWRRMNRHYERR